MTEEQFIREAAYGERALNQYHSGSESRIAISRWREDEDTGNPDVIPGKLLWPDIVNGDILSIQVFDIHEHNISYQDFLYIENAGVKDAQIKLLNKYLDTLINGEAK